MKVLCLLVLLSPCLGYKIYQDRIPNGDQIDHPCIPNYKWKGLGHLNPAGAGARNSFGIDFEKNGKKWDECLCETDSDGDGKTNGEELGDPLCKWKPGQIPHRITGLTHPGVCEPFDDPVCIVENRKLGDFCEGGHEIPECVEEVKKLPNIQKWNATFTVSTVPARETSYVCQTFEFPEMDQDYHAIAMHAHVDNEHVMHHMLMYACPDDVEITSSPESCDMGKRGCNELLFAWAVGSGGYCVNENAGFRFGKNGIKRVAIESHWNNPMLAPGYKDGSGMVVFFTPNLRQYDAASFFTGQSFLAIPPNRRDFRAEGTCESACTARYPHPIFITDTAIHMHYLGNRGYVYHKRDNRTINDLVIQDEYSYDSPIIFSHDPPIEFLPGDEFNTVCHFKTTSKNEYTYEGDATSDEMCLSIITYYPAMTGSQSCFQYMSSAFCTMDRSGGLFLGCNFTWFWQEEVYMPFVNRLYAACDPTGNSCRPSCDTLLKTLSGETPCLSGDALVEVKHTFKQYDAEELFRMIDSCPEKSDEDNWTKPDDGDGHSSSHENTGLCDGWSYPKTDAASDKSSSVFIMSIMMVATCVAGLS